MIFSTIAACLSLHSVLRATPDDYITRVSVTVTTGEDDMRSDSAGMIVMQYTDSRHQIAPIKRAGESLGSHTSKTITFTPNDAHLKISDFRQVRIDFSSGTSTGYNDKWTLDGVKVVVTMGQNEVTIYDRERMGMHLAETQHWTSMFFNAATNTDVINPADLWVELDGLERQDRNTQFLLDLETDDGRAWDGKESAATIQNPSYPGVRVEALEQDRIPVKSIRTLRIGYGKSWMSESDRTAAGSPGGSFNLRTARVFYKTANGGVQEFCTFNEINYRFADGGWWQAPFEKRFKRDPGFPIQAIQVNYITGKDDLRRMNFARRELEVCNSRIETTFNIPIVPGRSFCDWLTHGDWVRNYVHHTQPIVLQDGDEFPQGWTGTFDSYGQFAKIWRAVGTPYFLSSDLCNISVKFKRGAGGDLDRGGSSLDNLLRQPDDWDMEGIIISVGGRDHPMRRIYSNFAINQHMNAMDQTWRSPNFDTLLLRKAP